jgi:hypothetical protein
MSSPVGAPAPRVPVFVIFDADHDRDLYEVLHEQSESAGSRFAVIGGSEGEVESEITRDRVLQQIRAAAQVIVICGEHAGASPRVNSELLIAQEEEKPYFLLWGRRGVMCTKPIGAKPAEGMYSWKGKFLNSQIDIGLRKAATDAKARSLAKGTRDASQPSAGDSRT